MAHDEQEVERRMKLLLTRFGVDPDRPPPPPPAKDIDLEEFERRMALLEAKYRSAK